LQKEPETKCLKLNSEVEARMTARTPSKTLLKTLCVFSNPVEVVPVARTQIFLKKMRRNFYST